MTLKRSLRTAGVILFVGLTGVMADSLHRHVTSSRVGGLSSAVVGGTLSPMVVQDVPEILENGAGKFKVEIEGLIIDSFEIESVGADDMTIDYQVAGASADGTPPAAGFRAYGPGDAHFGSLTVRSRVGATSKELFAWWNATQQGLNIRKQISVIVLSRDGSPARRFNFLDCFPTSFVAEGPGAEGVAVDRLVLSMGGAEILVLGGGDGNLLAQRKPGLYVGLWNPGTPPQVTALWRTWQGGEPAFFLPIRRSRFHQTTPGHKYVDTLTLKGPLTSGRKALCEWFTAAVQGKPWKRQVIIKEITRDGSAGKTFTYIDCFPTRYVFPAFSASGTGNLKEEMTFKPIRLELS